MQWYQYIACVFGGAFLANAVPHFVKGICGDRFPSPFAKPPGKGLSSPRVNVVWALVNIVIGYLLVREGNVRDGGEAALIVFFFGAAAISIYLSGHFARKDRD
jgi:hypothetical protein